MFESVGFDLAMYDSVAIALCGVALVVILKLQ